jgi:DNA modification methylase
MTNENVQLEWTTVQRKVSDLVPYEHNPRILTEPQKQRLIESIEKFNLVEIPVINSDDTVIAGHQRLTVLMLLERGEELIDVRCPNRMLSELELKEYNIRSNVSIGMWDLDILDAVFSDIDLGALGLNVDDFKMPDSVLKELHPEEENEFNPEPPKDPISVLGDVYELESTSKRLKHVVVCGSSLEADTVEKALQGDLANAIVTDPPYNVNYEGGTQEKLKIENDSMSDGDFYQFLYDFYTNCFAFMEAGAPIYVFHADSEGANFRQALKDAGLKLAQCLIWVKQSIVMGRQDYHWKHEPILYGWKEGAAHKWYGDRKQSTVLEFNRPSRNADHPTMKPVEILCYLLEMSSERRNIVFDGFLGSGSLIIACEQLQRQCRGTELDPRYVDVEVRRWVQYMKDNNLPYSVKRNGTLLHEPELNRICHKD